jgi:hypothetical protein
LLRQVSHLEKLILWDLPRNANPLILIFTPRMHLPERRLNRAMRRMKSKPFWKQQPTTVRPLQDCSGDVRAMKN